MSVNLKCYTDNFGKFLLAKLVLVIVGLFIGHISHSSRSLFNTLSKTYLYLVLPCIAFNCFNSVTNNAHSDTPLQTSILLTDLITKGACWLAIVVGSLIVRRDRNCLKFAAIVAQFVIQNDDIGFNLSLLESSCRTESNEDYEFRGIELPSNAMTLLIFLPLTHSLVNMCNRADGEHGIKEFGSSLLKELYKFIPSYIALILGVVQVGLHESTVGITMNDYGTSRVIVWTETTQTLMIGIYIYYILMYCNWGDLKLKIILLYTLSITIVMPIVCTVIVRSILIRLKPDTTEHKTWDTSINEIVLAHTSAPASLYMQYYVHKHVKQPTNFMAAFLLSTFLGRLLTYAAIMDYNVLGDNDNTTINSVILTYTQTQRTEFLLMSLLISIFGLLIFCRRKQPVIRLYILGLLVTVTLADVVLVISLNFRSSTTPSAYLIVLSALQMFLRLVMSCIILLMTAYMIWPTVFKRAVRLRIALLCVGCALAIPTILYGVVWGHFQDRMSSQKSDYHYNRNITENILDILCTKQGEMQCCYPISAIVNLCLNSLLLMMYVAMMVLKWWTKNARADNTLLLPTEQYSRDKFVGCLAVSYYQMIIFASAIVFNGIDSNYNPPKMKSHWLQFARELCGLNSFILRDLLGMFVTVMFCISPGNMDKEYERLMCTPHKIKTLFTAHTVHSFDVENLPIDDLQHCRRFIMFHRQAFYSHYPPTYRNELAVFIGWQLVEFLQDTDVSHSLIDTTDIIDSYIRGGIFKVEQTIFRDHDIKFCQDESYVFTPLDDLPDYDAAIQQWDRPIRQLYLNSAVY